MVFVVIDLLPLSFRRILISPASFSSVIGAGRLSEGVTVMPRLVMMSSPLCFAFATLAGFARFLAMVIRAHALVMFPFFVASVLG